MKITYLPKDFSADNQTIIEQAERIVNEFSKYDLTLRQLYYQFVARGLFANTERNYRRLSRVISDARLAGKLDWNAITDRLRLPQALSHWDSVREIIESCAAQFRYNTRDTQDDYVEVWIEKDALAGVMLPVCEEYDVTAMVCRGYVSKSAMWQAAMRFGHQFNNGKINHIIHLGDHDPSGLDMTRDIRDQINVVFNIPVNVHRIALNMDQVQLYNPPPNPTKLTDSRSGDYVEKYGHECWELDALSPEVIQDEIHRKIEEFTDPTKWEERKADQDQARMKLQEMAKSVEEGL